MARRDNGTAANLQREAREANKRGDEFFAPKLTSFTAHNKSTGNVEKWAWYLEIIENAGWTLVSWQVDNSAAYPLFRRDT